MGASWILIQRMPKSAIHSAHTASLPDFYRSATHREGNPKSPAPPSLALSTPALLVTAQPDPTPLYCCPRWQQFPQSSTLRGKHNFEQKFFKILN